MSWAKNMTQDEIKEANRLKSARWRDKNRDRCLAIARESYHRNKHNVIKRKYGLSPEKHEAMKVMQDGDCMICGEREGTHVDHNHSTGKVRGLLCSQCNSAIGLMNDNPDVLKAGADYLEDHNARL